MVTMVNRGAFRVFELDGALLYFHPPTGTNVRIATPATQSARRRAPRVVMFGITNACNLACTFCSRDQRRDSLWTVASAAETLRGLARAGTLEVAFGGGEPFAFRGFAELVAELAATTPLALHATTNGTLLRAKTWAPFSGLMGQVRISIYDDPRWRDGARVLADDGQRWGANLIVENETLAALPARLAELERLGCHDVSLLAYIGPDARRHLDASGRARLAALAEGAPLPCRLSVCFGDRVPAPRLFDGADGSGDCGAGVDFVSITPDQKVQGCSFQGEGAPGATADEVLTAWQLRRVELTRPAFRDGCARLVPLASSRAAIAPPPVAIWQAFSGNNSGECMLVARFETIDDAETYLAELMPGWAADETYSTAWQELFRAENVAASNLKLRRERYDEGRTSPRELVSIGRTVLAASYHSGDAFPELRALAWKRGARVTSGGMHVHDDMTALVAIRGRDADDARRVADDARRVAAGFAHSETPCEVHGDIALVAPAFGREQHVDSFEKLRAFVQASAGPRPFAVDLFFEELAPDALAATLRRLDAPLATSPRLVLSMFGDDAAARLRALAAEIDEGEIIATKTCLLVGGLTRREHLAVLAHRRGAHVSALDSLTLVVCGHYRHPPPPDPEDSTIVPPGLEAEVLLASIRKALPPDVYDELAADESICFTTVSAVTSAPAAVIAAYDQQAAALGCSWSVSFDETDALAHAVRRLFGELRGPVK